MSKDIDNGTVTGWLAAWGNTARRTLPIARAALRTQRSGPTVQPRKQTPTSDPRAQGYLISAIANKRRGESALANREVYFCPSNPRSGSLAQAGRRFARRAAARHGKHGVVGHTGCRNPAAEAVALIGDVTPALLAVAPFDAAKAKEHQDAWAKHLGVESRSPTPSA